jgi:hypothetical protein
VTRSRAWVFGLSLSALAAACGGAPAPGGGDPAPGTERGPCYGNGTCNAGLVCLSELCVRPAAGDAGVGPEDAGAPPDGGAPPHDAGAPADAAPADAGPEDAGTPLDAELPDAGGPDAAPGDAGAPDTGPADAGVPDGGRADAGPQAMCEPVGGTGCPGGADLCLWDGNLDHLSCGTPGAAGFEAPCAGPQGCAVGHTCMQLPGEAGPECHRVCDLWGGGLSCQGLAGQHPLYNCSTVNGSQRYGVCWGVGAYCDPLAPACGAGEVCGLDGRGNTVCQPAGAAVRDGPCSLSTNCGVGQGMCIDLGAGQYCRQPCNPAQAGACGGAARCTQLIGEAYGICLPVLCHPFDAPCPGGSVCSAVAGPVECRPAGPVGLGGACSVQSECAAGVCVDLGAGDRCEAPCDGAHPCPSPQLCVTLTGFGFGICR